MNEYKPIKIHIDEDNENEIDENDLDVDNGKNKLKKFNYKLFYNQRKRRAQFFERDEDNNFSSLFMKYFCLFFVILKAVLFIFVITTIVIIFQYQKKEENYEKTYENSFHHKELGLLEDDEVEFVQSKLFNFKEYILKDGNYPILKRKLELKDLNHPDPVAKWNQKDISQLFLKKMKLFLSLQPDKNNQYPNNDNQQKYIDRLFFKSRFQIDDEDPLNITSTFKENITMEKIDENNELPSFCNKKIDVVWLYVNGNDIHWKERIMKYNLEFDFQRFRDYETLKYSIRSVLQNVEFVNNLFIVVADEFQIPEFLDKLKIHTIDEYDDVMKSQKDNEERKPNLFIIYHHHLFEDKSNIPTFNSNALEASLYNLPHVSECFIYLNDDMMILSKIGTNFIFNKKGQIRVFSNQWAIPYSSRNENQWEHTIETTNNELNKYYQTPNKRRLYPSHNCYFFRKSKLIEMNKKFNEIHKYSRQNKFRQNDDVAIPFLFNSYATEEGFGIKQFENDKIFKYFAIKNQRRLNKKVYDELKQKKLTFVCINDHFISHSSKQEERIKKEIKRFIDIMEEIFPDKSSFEF